MKLLIWALNFHPEPTGFGSHTADLARHAGAYGISAEVLTGFSYLPRWRKQGIDRWALYRYDSYAGVPVNRCWHYVPGRLSPVRRLLHELSFALCSFVCGLFSPRPDLYLVVTPPAVLGFFGWLLATIKRRPWVLQVQDLALGESWDGEPLPAPLAWLVRKLEAFVLRRAPAVTAVSPGLLRALQRRGPVAGAQLVVPNWVRPEWTAIAEEDWRARLGIGAEEFVMVFAGALDARDDLEVALDAAGLWERADPDGRPIRLVIAGAGPVRPALWRRAHERNLERVTFLPLLEPAQVGALLRQADVGLVTEAAAVGGRRYPLKLLRYLAAELPVVLVTDPEGELAQEARSAEFGVVCAPGDARELADAVMALRDDAERCQQLRAGSRWVRQWEREKLLPDLLRLLVEVAELSYAAARPEPAADRRAASDES